jgi:hypothetical protein
MDSVTVPRKLWEHPNPETTEMYRLMQEINKNHNLQLKVGLLLTLFCNSDIWFIDILGSLPILHYETSPVLGPGFPIPRLDLQRFVYEGS